VKAPESVVITAAVEGPVDEAVVRKMITFAGGKPGKVYGRNGKPGLLKRLSGFNNMAKYKPWIVLVDLNSDEDCAPSFRKTLLKEPAPYMCFRVVVHEIEAWLMGDSEMLAKFLYVRPQHIPEFPEKLKNPKRKMVDLARYSRSRDIREDMVPRPESQREVGPAYTSRLIEFVRDHWRPGVASKRVDSLKRAMECLKRVIDSYQNHNPFLTT
jgi:hypothetical protein